MGKFSSLPRARMDMETPSPTDKVVFPMFRFNFEVIPAKAVKTKCCNQGKISLLSRETIPCPKERHRRKEGYLGSFTFKSVYSKTEIQDDHDRTSPFKYSIACLDIFSRPQRRLLSHPNEWTLSKISGFQFGRNQVQVSRNAIWPLHSSKSLHQNDEHSSQRPAGTGDSSSCLLGRFNNLEHFGRKVRGRYPEGSSAPHQDRFSNELQQEQNKSSAEIRTFGSSVEYAKRNDTNSLEAHREYSLTNRGDTCSGIRFQKEASTGNGEGKFRFSSGPSFSLHSQGLGRVYSKETSQTFEPERSFSSFKTITTVSDVLEANSENISVSAHEDTCSVNSSLHRLLNRRLGIPHRLRDVQSREMEPTSARSPHQFEGNDCRSHSPEGTRSSASELSHKSVLRQYVSSLHSEKVRFSSFKTTEQLGIEHLQTDSEEELVHINAPHPRKSERVGRSTVTKLPNSNRVGAGQGQFQVGMQPDNSAGDRPLCDEVESQANEIHLSVPGPSSSGDRCFHGRLESVVFNLHVSTDESDFEGFRETDLVQGDSHSHRPDVADGPMVRNDQVQNDGIQDPTPSPVTDGSRRDILRYICSHHSPTRMDLLKSYFAKQYSTAAAEFLSTDIRTSSMRQYESIFKKFIAFFRLKSFEGISTNVFIEFFIECFQSMNLAPSTIASYKSALKPIADIFEVDLNSPCFDSLLRSFRLRKPATQNTMLTWDLDTVLDFIESYENPTEPRFILRKTVFLIQLALGCRVSELCGLSRNPNLTQFLENGSVSMLGNPNILRKHEFADKRDPASLIPPLKDEDGSTHPLCPVEALKVYMRTTENRAPSQELFLHPTSSRPLSRSGLANHIVALIKSAAPSSTARSHDVRKIAASVAIFKHMAVDTLTQRGHWSSAKTFWRRYNKSIFKLQHRVVTMGQAQF